jgi:hypothetical protein
MWINGHREFSHRRKLIIFLVIAMTTRCSEIRVRGGRGGGLRMDKFKYCTG